MLINHIDQYYLTPLASTDPIRSLIHLPILFIIVGHSTTTKPKPNHNYMYV